MRAGDISFSDEVFSIREIAQAVGVAPEAIRNLVGRGAVGTVAGHDGYLPWQEAIRVGRLVLPERAATAAASELTGDARDRLAQRAQPLFAPLNLQNRAARAPAAVSIAAHAATLAIVIWGATIGISTHSDMEVAAKPERLRLVYLNLPGPGGGGGGGGARQKIAPPRAERKGSSKLSSPVVVRKPAPLEPPPKPVEPEPIKTETLPPVVAPVVAAPADQRDRPGVLADSSSQSDSKGPGGGGGVGTGQGTGIGEGDGPGLGPGSGGGTGGGPYRPGSGIEAPRLLREVRPDYTEEARTRNIEGEVLLEIVVRADGTVGETRLVNGLGHGLDQRAIQAVRQWRFAPARRLGRAVDVLVEVAIEFKLR